MQLTFENIQIVLVTYVLLGLTFIAVWEVKDKSKQKWLMGLFGSSLVSILAYY
jgi:hypothetical protein